MKNREYNKKNELLTNKIIINSFEKKPINGGTPAIDKSITVIANTKNELKLRVESEWRVLKPESIKLKNVQKSSVKDMLYINIYAYK